MVHQKKTRTLDLFNVLTQISTKNADFFNTLDEAELKEFQPFVVMRWLTGTTDARQIFFINELVNRFVFELGSHKSLLYKLLCVSTSGQGKRYQWKKANTKRTSPFPLSVGVIKQYFSYNTKEANEVVNILSPDQIYAYAEELGTQKDDLSKLKKELKTRDEKIL